ncbi:hypothetical protein [Lacticaseibacillus saniviri]|uniref:Uncharacterized protein n=1 Tax=Lacticaseibacillus saniviri JCM 17471 = DSM 24301 TaxID=1293598 RepID=A0A0R2MS12_9LACO|nr:hypothetical protein [Lacticaseibacillus saniviri]KRO15564.1 hypothetical protein IV56_GL002333 [Lacticaseibacillus saniviri JCM 17471 = DSM 24301]
MSKRLNIDPEKFAYKFLDAISIDISPDKVDVEKASKEALAAYLSAYYLADRFNHTENSFFADPDTHVAQSSYQRILSELNQY